MRQPRFFQIDSYYHLISRGNNLNLFLFLRDYRKFLYNLGEYSNKFNVKIVAFALMPNHIHLLARQNEPNSISKFMQAAMTSYALYFNRKHRRTGHLFQDRFKHVLVDTDEYLLHLSRYIHLNPSSAGLERRPEDYAWSSYRHYLGLENIPFVDEKPILSYYSKDKINQYKDFVESRINYQRELNIAKLFLE